MVAVGSTWPLSMNFARVVVTVVIAVVVLVIVRVVVMVIVMVVKFGWVSSWSSSLFEDLAIGMGETAGGGATVVI